MVETKVETKVERTVSHQGVASSFCTHTPQGFGYLPSSVRFDPKNVKIQFSAWHAHTHSRGN
jgi:hypothetical protein